MTYLKTHTFGCGLVLAASLLGGCGSSGGSSDNNAAQSEISGSVFASYMEGASVSIYDTAGNLVAGPVMTNAQGGFTIKIDTALLDTELVFKSTGGTFTDEVQSGGVTIGGALSALLESDALSGAVEVSVNLTPSTTLVERLVSEHDKTLDQAKEDFEGAFGFVPNPHIMPKDATIDNADASADQKLAGLRAAAFSQLTNDLGLTATQQFELVVQLADDLSDGTLDGKDGATALEVGETSLGDNIQSKYSQSFVDFKVSDKNKTSLTNTEIGILPFAQLAMTDSYKLQYVPGMMKAMEGKTTFKVKITDLENNPVTDLSPMLMPMMNMASHSHSTPKGSFVEDEAEEGTYIATVYFVMASQMSSGMSMGYWDLKVSVGEESAHFYPPVMMAMGDTALAKLKDQNDEIQSMDSMMMPRPYFLFNNGLSTAGDNHDFSIFLATKDSMMSFPSLNADSVIVEMSTNQTTWTTAAYTATGIWTGSDLSGLTAGEEGIIYVKLTVDDLQATDTGEAPDASDENSDEAMFFVTPSAGMQM